MNARRCRCEEENISCNSVNYVEMLKNSVIPAIARRSDGERVWFMQDGAPAHHSNHALSFLRDKFGDRLIALGTKDNPTPVTWPPHSPELNVCDYWSLATVITCQQLVNTGNYRALMVCSLNLYHTVIHFSVL